MKLIYTSIMCTIASYLVYLFFEAPFVGLGKGGLVKEPPKGGDLRDQERRELQSQGRAQGQDQEAEEEEVKSRGFRSGTPSLRAVAGSQQAG